MGRGNIPVRYRAEDLRHKIFVNHPSFSLIIYAHALKDIAARFHLTYHQLYYLIIADTICEVGNGYYKYAQVREVVKFLDTIKFGSFVSMNMELINLGVAAFHRRDGNTKLFFITVYGENILKAFQRKIKIRTSKVVELIHNSVLKEEGDRKKQLKKAKRDLSKARYGRTETFKLNRVHRGRK